MSENICLKKTTVGFIKAFYIIVTAMYFIALMTVSCAQAAFPDFATAFYWFSEIMNSANRILFIGAAVCIGIEISGIK